MGMLAARSMLAAGLLECSLLQSYHTWVTLLLDRQTLTAWKRTDTCAPSASRGVCTSVTESGVISTWQVLPNFSSVGKNAGRINGSSSSSKGAGAGAGVTRVHCWRSRFCSSQPTFPKRLQTSVGEGGLELHSGTVMHHGWGGSRCVTMCCGVLLLCVRMVCPSSRQLALASREEVGRNDCWKERA